MRNLLALAAVALAACVGPTTTVRSVDTRPALAIVGAPSGTLLFVDGAQVGDARAYEGQPDVLRLEPGTHDVEIRTRSGEVVFRQRVFLESELKTLRVH